MGGSFLISGDEVSIEARGNEEFIQRLVDHATGYVAAANRRYVEEASERARQKERMELAALEKEIAQAELRKKILARIKV
jgi:hypothetical protein